MSATTIILKNVILSYPHLAEAWAGTDMGDPKYRASFLIPFSDTASMKAVTDAIIAAYQIGIDKMQFVKPKANQPLDLAFIVKALDGKVTFFDGEAKQHKTYHLGEPENPELANYAELRTSAPASRPPAVYSKYAERFDEKTKDRIKEAFAGEIVHAELNAYPYTSGSKGISIGLNRVILTQVEGVLGRLDGGAMSEEFAGLFSEFNPNDVTEEQKEPEAFAM